MAGVFPTIQDVQNIRGDVESYMVPGKTLLDNYLPQALKELQFGLYNIRNHRWNEYFHGDNETGTYYDPLGDGMNQAQIQFMMSLRAIALVFEDYAIKMPSRTNNNAPSQWWDLAHEYRDRYNSMLNEAKLIETIAINSAQPNNLYNLPNAGYFRQ